MSPNLLPIDTLLAALREASSQYLFPLLIALALLVVVTALVMDRERPGRPRADERPVMPPSPLAARVPAPMPVPVSAVLQPPAEAAPAPAAPRAVLVVDDSAVARTKLRRLFEGAGYGVTAVRDGLEALDALGAGFYSVLVTDLEMPNMSGIELIASVQGSLDTEDLPIVAITGHDEMQAHARDYQGLYGIFKKPWNDRELLKRVEALAGLRKPPARAARPPVLRHDAGTTPGPTPALH